MRCLRYCSVALVESEVAGEPVLVLNCHGESFPIVLVD